MAKNDISAGRAFVELYVKQGALVAGLRSAEKRLKNWGQSAMLAGGAVSGAGAALLAPIAAAVKVFADQGDALDKMAARTGASVEALSELGFAMEQSGSDAAMLEKGLFGLSRAYFDLERGGAASKDAFGAIGIGLEELQQMNPEQQLARVADGLAGVEDMAKRGAIAQAIFGRAGRQMLPMLADGAAGLEKMRQEARDLGLSRSAEEAADAAAVTDAINRVQKAFGSAIFTIGSAFVPTVLDALDVAKEAAVGFSRWIKENQQLVRTVGAIGLALVVAGGAITGFGLALTIAGTALGGIASGITLVVGMIGAMLSPFGIMVGLIGGAVAAWLLWTDAGQNALNTVREAFGNILDTARTTLGGIMDALSTGNFALAAEIAVGGLRLAFLQGFAGLQQLIGGIWGDTVASIGNALLDGDIQGAWQAGISALGSAWAEFASYVVGLASRMAKKVVEVWASMVGGLAKGMLQAASGDGIGAKVMQKVLGVDVAEEVKRAEAMNKRARELGLATSDPMADAFADVDRQLAMTTDQANAFLDDMALSFEQKADAATAKAKNVAAEGAGEFQAQLDAEAAKLAGLRAGAAELAEARRLRLAKGKEDAAREPLGAALGSSVAGTFSGAALGLLGGGSPVKRMADDMHALRVLAAEQKGELVEIRRNGPPKFTA